MENMNNKVYITGEIVSDFQYSHQIYGEKFYLFNVSSKRTSGYADVIPVLISERLIDVKQSYIGKYIGLTGQYRSYNTHEENGRKLILIVFVQENEFLDAVVTGECCNQIELIGYICKETSYRKTPSGREIADVLIAVNRQYGKSDYIPCICWGRSARYAGELEVGSKIKITGRIQSREYVKKIGDDKTEKRVAYEVSAYRIDLIEEEEDAD